MEKLYTCEEVAARYNVDIRRVWIWIREHKLGAIKAGGKKYMVPESDLQNFEKERRV